jgi:hypothetical protein
MGTSSAYGGPGGGTPLVPTWLEPADAPGDGNGPGNDAPAAPPPAAPTLPPVQPPPVGGRFTAARGNFSRFAGSGGQDTASLGRAVSGYVSTASGGARQAGRRMGSSRAAGANLLGFLSGARAQGAREALRALNLADLAGRPIEEVFLGLVDYVCPDGGTVDEGIAREAFIETIVDLAVNGITDLDTLTADQMQTVFELYATHAIEARLCNDIGAKTILLPRDVRTAERVQAQLRDFIRRGVSDALTSVRQTLQVLTQDRVLEFVGRVYEQTFAILQSLGEAEANAA